MRRLSTVTVCYIGSMSRYMKTCLHKSCTLLTCTSVNVGVDKYSDSLTFALMIGLLCFQRVSGGLNADGTLNEVHIRSHHNPGCNIEDAVDVVADAFLLAKCNCEKRLCSQHGIRTYTQHYHGELGAVQAFRHFACAKGQGSSAIQALNYCRSTHACFYSLC